MNDFNPEKQAVYICFGSGTKYEHQYNGLHCSHVTIKNPTLLGHSDNKIFDPKFWYSLYWFPDHRFVIPNYKSIVSKTLYKSIMNKAQLSESVLDNLAKQDLAIAKKSKNKITYSELQAMFVAAINDVNPKYTDFKIVDGKFYEAYVGVTFLFQNKRKHGFVVWENCD